MKNTTLISWNVNGIRAIERKGFLDWFSETNPDILCLQETKAHPEQCSEHLQHVPGYHVYWASAERKGYSGVATYTKEEPLHVSYGFGIDEFDSEGRMVVTEFSTYVLCNVYFPNGKKDTQRLQYKLDFYNQFLQFADQARAKGKSFIVCGDVNTAHQPIDLARPKQNEKVSGFLPIERSWIDTFIEHGYIDTFRTLHPNDVVYSWWDYKTGARKRNVGWRIDYFFVSDDLIPLLKEAFTLPDIMGSDHCPIGIRISST